jgi:hypothetical protein
VVDSFRSVIWPEGLEQAPLKLELRYHPADNMDVASIEILTRQGKVFGPQPFLAIQTLSRRFIHDNLDFAPSLDRWFYAFHGDTLPISDVAQIGIAANDEYGNTNVCNLDLERHDLTKSVSIRATSLI